MNLVSARAGNGYSVQSSAGQKTTRKDGEWLMRTYIADAVCIAVLECVTDVNLILSAIVGGRCNDYSVYSWRNWDMDRTSNLQVSQLVSGRAKPL